MKLKSCGLFLFFSLCVVVAGIAQCGPADIMEPGFQFLSSSRGCAPFNVQIETRYLAATPGTIYYVDWGDGVTQSVTQVGPSGVILSHTYPNSPVDCGYDVIIDTENTCNPRGSVVPITTQVVVWTNDVLAIDPLEFRVCQGFAETLSFTDNSDWNCYPRATRENNVSRWIQWIYGTGPAGNQIPGVQVNSVTPGVFPYLDPAANRNPRYPVNAPGLLSLPISVPATTPAQVGREFVITLKNWNQCNPYDITPANGSQNPADLVNGDNPPEITTARIVIVPSPQPDYFTRLGNAGGPLQSVFCLGDDIYFDNETPAIAGANFAYTWQFFDNATGTGSPIATRTSTNPVFAYTTTGVKLVRLRVTDTNAAGSCEMIFDATISISPSLIAEIAITDFSGIPLTPDFCQENTSPLTNFQARFSDVSAGTPTASTQWRWEFYNELNTLVLEAPTGGAYSSSALGPFDRTFTNPGLYRAVLRVRDNVTGCETVDEENIRVLRKPVPEFTFDRVCEGTPTTISDASTLNGVGSQQIILREWDLDYDGVTFSKDPALDNETTISHTFLTAGTHSVALQVTTDLGGCSEIIEHEIIVDAIPLASFTADRTSGCSVLRVTFTNTSISGQPDLIKEFHWEIDNGSGFQVDSVQKPTDPGFSNVFARDFVNTSPTDVTFDVRLRVITVNDCEQVSAPITLTVFPGPISGFTSINYSPFNNNCSPVSVSFSVDNQTQLQNPSDYLWTVLDGATTVAQQSTGTTPSFTHNFVNTTQGIKDFAVMLTATLPTGCFGDSTRVIRINPVPSSDFAVDTIAYECERAEFLFDATQSGLQQYEWTLIVNGITLFSTVNEGESFTHEFQRSTTIDQNVEVRLQTTNFANCESTVTSRFITVTRTDVINAGFTVTPMVQQFPDATVTISNTTNPGPWNYLWDFGDGTLSTSNAAQLTHSYSTHGFYTIMLMVNNGDCFETQSATIEIRPATPVLEFVYDPSSGCLPLTVNFTDQSQFTDPATYAWSFGDGQGASNAVNPSYTYYEPGVYSVTMSAGNGEGEEAQITKQLIIEVFPRPSAQFNLMPTQIQFPGGILYTDNQSFGASSFEWNFGDGYISTDFEPTHEYTYEGVFNITLIATNTEGCSDTTRLESGVRTIRSGQILVPNAFSPNTSGPGNSGGQNDLFRPILVGVTEYQLMIFNRWGELLFETRDPEAGWDGYYKGRLCQQDVYVYKIVGKYSNGERVNKVGDIHLIR